MARNICDDLEAVGDYLLGIKERVENEQYDPQPNIDMQLEAIGGQVQELREIVAEWLFNNLPREKQKAALL